MPGNDQKLAWVTGAAGLIGSNIVYAAPRFVPDWRVKGLTREDFDLTDFPAMKRQFQRDAPALVIHCAAVSDPVACEADPVKARLVNREATFFLAGLAGETPFIFLSSDLVFDGREGNYHEPAQPNPLFVYAQTKAEAEVMVLENPLHTVVRAALNGGVSPRGNRGFNTALRNAWKAGKRPRLFTDEFRSPLPATLTARALWELALVGKPGLYHLGGAERLSRFQIGGLMAQRCPELNPRIQSSSIRDFKGPARPPDVSLNCAKLQALLSFPLPGLTAWLRDNPDEPF